MLLWFLMWMHFLHVLSPGSSHIFSPTSRHRNHKIFSLQELFSIKTAHDTRQETVWNWEPMSDGMKYFLILATDPAPWRILCLSVLQTVSVLLASLRHSSDTADPHCSMITAGDTAVTMTAAHVSCMTACVRHSSSWCGRVTVCFTAPLLAISIFCRQTSDYCRLCSTLLPRLPPDYSDTANFCK